MSISIDWNPEKSCILRGHAPGGVYGDPWRWVMTARFPPGGEVFVTGLCVAKGCELTLSDHSAIKNIIRNEWGLKKLTFDRDINGKLIRREYE